MSEETDIVKWEKDEGEPVVSLTLTVMFWGLPFAVKNQACLKAEENKEGLA